MGLEMVVRNIVSVVPLWHYIFQGSVDWFLVHPHIQDMKHHFASSTQQDVDSMYWTSYEEEKETICCC